MQEAVTNGVGEGGLADVLVPLGRRQLVRDDRRPHAVAILEDLQDVAPLLVLERGEGPVVDEQHVYARELAEETDVSAVGAGQGQLVEEARGPATEAAVALPAGRSARMASTRAAVCTPIVRAQVMIRGGVHSRWR